MLSVGWSWRWVFPTGHRLSLVLRSFSVYGVYIHWPRVPTISILAYFYFSILELLCLIQFYILLFSLIIETCLFLCEGITFCSSILSLLDCISVCNRNDIRDRLREMPVMADNINSTLKFSIKIHSGSLSQRSWLFIGLVFIWIAVQFMLALIATLHWK